MYVEPSVSDEVEQMGTSERIIEMSVFRSRPDGNQTAHAAKADRFPSVEDILDRLTRQAKLA